jgi:large subunit ribosomal protein L24e
MVINTGTCGYTEYKVYPGRGERFVTKDGKLHLFISKKASQLYKRKIKAVKLTWSQAWRRFNSKGKVETGIKKRAKKRVKVQKAIVGMNIDIINRKKNAGEKEKVREQVAKEIKERQRRKLDQRKQKQKQKISQQPKKQVQKRQDKKGAASGPVHKGRK